MIDKRLYQETFSHLRASDQAKQEVFQKMQEMKHRKRMPRVLRGAAIAAAISLDSWWQWVPVGGRAGQMVWRLQVPI